MPQLFEVFNQRSVTFRNRIAVSPMCQYYSEDGFANDLHLVHLVSRAVGGAGLVLTVRPPQWSQRDASPHKI